MYKEDLSLCGIERADTCTDLPRCALVLAQVGQKPTVKEIGKVFVLSKLEDTLSLACNRRCLGLLQLPLYIKVTVNFTFGSHSRNLSCGCPSEIC